MLFRSTIHEKRWITVSGYSFEILKSLFNEDFNLILHTNHQNKFLKNEVDRLYYLLEEERYDRIQI